MFQLWHDFWNEFWSASTAIGTLALAIATFAVIKQSKSESRRIERHHRDQFKPLCVLVEGENFFPPQIAFFFGPGINASILVQVNASLRNSGVGPAFNLRMYLNYGSPGYSFSLFSTNKPIETSKTYFLSGGVIKEELTFEEESVVRFDLGLVGKFTGIEDLNRDFATEKTLIVIYENSFKDRFITEYPIELSEPKINKTKVDVQINSLPDEIETTEFLFTARLMAPKSIGRQIDE